MEMVLAAETSGLGGVQWLIWGLFLIAGLLVGGVYSAYKNGSKAATLVMAVLAAGAVLAAVLMLLGVVETSVGAGTD
ncbi:MAG TPA: hypothetical protein VFC72_06670 [Corynebacterium sp.]|nr:hypothetical protein [Corynebacterium sp.]